ncbi:MAG: GTP-binding protein EngB [Methanosarcinales archaeon]|nr:GTP-binding protein EngB [Methanosarcinales archaeon]MCK4810928.1 GTP-binding protein EngB [Methanosarcinales archaeon]
MHVTHEIIFAGRSNVGKSSLIRRLTGKRVKTGRLAGVTRKPTHIAFKDLLITDLPGYGFLHGIPNAIQERIKDQIIHYIEDNEDRIVCAVQVIDASAFCEIVDRWQARGEIPVDIEMFEFLCDLDMNIVIAANKTDLVKDRDHNLDQIVERFDLLPPWRQWLDTVAPVSAKKGDVAALTTLLRDGLHRIGRDDLFGYFRM